MAVQAAAKSQAPAAPVVEQEAPTPADPAALQARNERMVRNAEVKKLAGELQLPDTNNRLPVLGELMDAKKSGLIDERQFGEAIADLQDEGVPKAHNAVRKMLIDLRKADSARRNQADILAKADADQVTADLAAVQKPANVSKKAEKTNTSGQPVQETPKSIQVAAPAPLTAKETPANVPQPANPGKAPPAAPVEKAAAVAGTAVATIAAARPSTGLSTRTAGTDVGMVLETPEVQKTPDELADDTIAKLNLDPDKVVMVGVKGKETPMRARDFILRLANAPRKEFARVMALMGRDADGDQVGKPLTLDQVALLESRQMGGKPVSKEAIRITAGKYGISAKMVNMLIGTDLTSLDGAELTNGEASLEAAGYRTGASLSKLTSDGQISDEGSSINESLIEPGEAAPRLSREDRKTLTLAGKAASKQTKLQNDNAAVDEHLAPPKIEAPAVMANRITTAEKTKNSPVPRLAQVNGQLEETEIDEQAQKKRALESEVKAAQIEWNAKSSRTESDTSFEDSPAEIQAEFVRLLRAADEGTISYKQLWEERNGLQLQADQGAPALRGPDRGRAGPALEGPTQGGGRRDDRTLELEAPASRAVVRDAADSAEVRDGDSEVTDTANQDESRALVRDAYEQAEVSADQEFELSKEYDAEPGTDEFLDALSRDMAEPNAELPKAIRKAVSKVNGAAGARLSQGETAQGSTVAQVTAEVTAMMPVSQRLVVVDKLTDLPAAVQDAVRQQSSDGQSVQGFVLGSKSYLIAGNITPGTARAVFLHEVGVHLGLEKLLSPAQLKALADQLRTWAARADGSRESKLAIKALARVEQAGTQASDQNSEMIAYFTEEAVNAGIDPTAMQYKGEMARWFRSLWAAFKTAMRTLGINPDKLTAQDVVDMAYGAARLEMNGARTITQAGLQIETPAFKAWYGDWQNAGDDTTKNVERTAPAVGGTSDVVRGTADVNAVQRSGGVGVYSGGRKSVGKITLPGTAGPVDASGKPVVFYHGTRDDFNAFRTDHPNRKDKGWLGRGVYLTSDATQADDYSWAKRGSSGRSIMPLYAAVKTPFVASIELKARLKNASQGEIDTFTQGLVAQGYDGVILENEDGNVELVDFEPTQVKSSTGNNGKFDLANPDIRRSVVVDQVKFSVGQAQANQRLAETGQAVGSTLTRWMQNVGNAASFTEDLIRRAVTAGMASAKAYEAAQAARNAEVNAHTKRVAKVMEKFSNLNYDAQQTVNKMLYDSTREAKWAYVPSWDAKTVVDPVMAARFKALEKQSPAAAEFVKAAFQHG